MGPGTEIESRLLNMLTFVKASSFFPSTSPDGLPVCTVGYTLGRFSQKLFFSNIFSFSKSEDACPVRAARLSKIYACLRYTPVRCMPCKSCTPVREVISTRIIPLRSYRRLSYRRVVIIGHTSHRCTALTGV